MGWWWVTEERRAYLKEGASEVELWEEEIFSPSPSKLQTQILIPKIIIIIIKILILILIYKMILNK